MANTKVGMLEFLHRRGLAHRFGNLNIGYNLNYDGVCGGVVGWVRVKVAVESILNITEGEDIIHVASIEGSPL